MCTLYNINYNINFAKIQRYPMHEIISLLLLYHIEPCVMKTSHNAWFGTISNEIISCIEYVCILATLHDYNTMPSHTPVVSHNTTIQHYCALYACEWRLTMIISTVNTDLWLFTRSSVQSEGEGLFSEARQCWRQAGATGPMQILHRSQSSVSSIWVGVCVCDLVT